MIDKLKRCPFCDGEAYTHSRCNYYETDGKIMFFVRCKACGAESPWYYKKEETIKEWNTRKPMNRIVERLEDVKCDRMDVAYHTMDVFVDGQVSGLEKAIEIVKEEGDLSD